MRSNKPTADAISVKISKATYKRVREYSKKNGHSISWLLNHAIGVWFQEFVDKKEATNASH